METKGYSVEIVEFIDPKRVDAYTNEVAAKGHTLIQTHVLTYGVPDYRIGEGFFLRMLFIWKRGSDAP